MKEFDFIIIGAGSAGCVLSYRLSQDKNSKILYINKVDILDIKNDK